MAYGWTNTYCQLAPEAAKVLETTHTATCSITHTTLGTSGQVTLHPLVRNGELEGERERERERESIKH